MHKKHPNIKEALAEAERSEHQLNEKIRTLADETKTYKFVEQDCVELGLEWNPIAAEMAMFTIIDLNEKIKERFVNNPRIATWSPSYPHSLTSVLLFSEQFMIEKYRTALQRLKMN